MHWIIKVLLFVIVCTVILWNVWARVLAAIVSALSTRRGVKVKMESLTMRRATNVLVIFSARGMIDEIRCRRIQIGWISSACQGAGRDENEDEDSPASILQRLFMLLSMCRLHVRAVGVQIRLRGCQQEEDVDSVDPASKSVPGSGNAGILVKSILPLVSFEVNDVEVYSVRADGMDSMFRGKKIALDLKRMDQDLLLENIYLCPGRRFVKNDTICNECGLVEINRMAVTSKNSLHEFFTLFKRQRLQRHRRKENQKSLSVDVSSIRLNLDTRYLNQIKAWTTALKRDSSKMKTEKRSRMDVIHEVLGNPFMPISVDLAFRAVTIHLPLSKIENQIDLRGLRFDLQTITCDSDLNEIARIESSVVWDKITAVTGESVDGPTWECQSSRSESKATLCIPCSSMESTDIPQMIDAALHVHIYALHTKLHHEHLGGYVCALGSSLHQNKSPARKPSSKSLFPFNAKMSISLGNGSSLQFVNADSVCMLHHSIDSATVTFSHSMDTKVESGTGLKFEFSGIAMADATSIMKSEIHELCEVLTNDSFSGSLALDGNRHASVNVSVSNLAGKITDTLMRHICSIATSILENSRSMSKIAETDEHAQIVPGVQKPTVSFRADLMNINVAVLSTYTVRKVNSSINKDQKIDSAVAIKIESLSASRSQSGLHSASGEDIMILYYEGNAVEDFNIDFDLMDDSIHAKPFILESFGLEESLVDDVVDRQISVGKLEFYGHVDALLSVVHFSKSMEEFTGFSCRDDTKSSKAGTSGKNMKTMLKLADANLCMPVSSDREVSLTLQGCEFEHSKRRNSASHFSMGIYNTSVSIKGSDIMTVRNFASEVESRLEENGCIVQNLSLSLDEIRFILPYNRDPGPTFKVLSLYIKACSSLISSLKPTSNHSKQVHKNESDKIQRIIDARIRKGAFIFEHHPLEAWYARTSTARSHAKLLQHLWDEAHTSVMSEYHESPLHGGIRSTGHAQDKMGQEDDSDSTVKTAHLLKDKSWKRLMSRHADNFIKDENNDGAPSLYQDLFKVDFGSLKLSAKSNCQQVSAIQEHEEAVNFISGIDKGSKDMMFKKSLLFTVDMSVDEAQVMIGGSNQPMYAGKGVLLDGKIAFGKQSTRDPETCDRLIYIGMHHVYVIQTPAKGTSPPFKIFSDVSLQAERSQVFFSPGFEPALGLMGVTSKRLVPSDPDFAAKRPPSVPWWDDIRYFWRGNASVWSNSLQVTLLPGASPALSATKERLEIDATSVEIKIRPCALTMNTENMKIMGFRKTLEEHGGQLCGFPVADVNSMNVQINIDWRLPHNRKVNDHYIFPPSTDEGKQSPLFVADLYKATGVDASFHVSFTQNDSNSGPPRLFIGGEIVSFWKKFVSDMKIPDYIKNQVRKGTYFVKKPKGIKKKGLPLLLDRLNLTVDCKELQMVHFTLDQNDPGGGLVVGTSEGELKMAWRCNQESVSFLTSPPHATKPAKHQKANAMKNLHVFLNKVAVKSMKLSMDIEKEPTSTIFRQNTSSSGELAMSLGLGLPQNTFHPGEPHWIADTVSISRSMEDLPDDDPFSALLSRPLKVVVDKCSFLTDLDMRDAIWATIEHLIAAFTQRERRHDIVSRLHSTRAVGESGEISNLQRAYSHTSDISASAENNELLSLLLQQKEAAGASPLVSPQAPLDLERLDSATAEPDILPMTTSLDDANSELKYEVEVRNLQLMLQRDHESGTSTGRLLLATKSATLQGMVSDHHLCMYNITTLDMEDVQAYISLSSVDPSAKVVWLGIADDREFITPSVDDTDSVWRRIFNPININLRHSKYQAPKLANSRKFTIPSPVLTNNIQRQGEELILKVPEIAAVMDGREFEVLIDVVSFLITLGPTVRTCRSVANLLNHSDDQNITNEQSILQLSCRQLESIRNEIYGIYDSLLDFQHMYEWSNSGSLPYSGGLNVPVDLLRMVESDFYKNPSDSLRMFIQQKSEDTNDTAKASEHLNPAMLLLQWSCEQEILAEEQYNSAKSRLLDTTEQLKRQTQFKTSSRVLIHLNRVVWQLCNQDRVPFVQASIKKVLFDSRRNRDRSGSARFIIQSLDILDATGMLPDGPATSAGVILTSWNPESSYEREPVLRIISTLGVPTSRFDVFEHLDATLHPLSLHLTEQIATACWEYFFPKEDQKSRQEAFTNTVLNKKIASNTQPISPSQKIGGASKTIGSHGGSLETMTEASSSSPLVKQDSDASSRSDILGHTSSPSMKRRDSPIVRRKKSSTRLLKRFRYVKLNRAHMRITYQGYPLGIKDRVLVINSYTCENLDGTWRDLLSNVKQKAIFSALFSGLGLQGRKVKELMIGAAPSLSSIELPKSQDEDLGNNRGLLAKFGLKQNKGRKRGDHTDNKNDLELQKKRALFGEGILHRAKGLFHDDAYRPSSVPTSPRIDEGPTEVQRKLAVPLLELTEPLPPEPEDSSDSDASQEDDEIPVKVPFTDGPGPLKAGIESYNTKQSKEGAEHHVSYSGYDPNKPPELGVKPSQGKSSGPRWMK